MTVDGGGGLTDNMSSQYIRLHLVARGPWGPPQPPNTQRHYMYLFIYFISSHPYSVHLWGGGSKGSKGILIFKKINLPSGMVSFLLQWPEVREGGEYWALHMCGSGRSGRGRTKYFRPKRSGVNVISHKGHDVCVCEHIRWQWQSTVEWWEWVFVKVLGSIIVCMCVWYVPVCAGQTLLSTFKVLCVGYDLHTHTQTHTYTSSIQQGINTGLTL